MREIIFFAAASSLLAAIFLVSLIELIFTVKRNRVNFQLQNQIKEMKAAYNGQINQIVLEEGDKLDNADQLTSEIESEKAKLEQEYQDKIDGITAKSQKSLEKARERARSLEKDARQEAEDYLKSRQKEVENDLLNLVISVSKKVLPEGISYQDQKKLVIHALEELKEETE
jgi:hypothetical protein